MRRFDSFIKSTVDDQWLNDVADHVLENLTVAEVDKFLAIVRENQVPGSNQYRRRFRAGTGTVWRFHYGFVLLLGMKLQDRRRSR